MRVIGPLCPLHNTSRCRQLVPQLVCDAESLADLIRGNLSCQAQNGQPPGNGSRHRRHRVE